MKRMPATRAYDRRIRKAATIASAAERLKTPISLAVDGLVSLDYRRHGIPEDTDLVAPVLAKCRELYRGTYGRRMRIGDISEALAQAINGLYGSDSQGIEDKIPQNPQKLLDAMRIMERVDALLALALLLVGRDPREDVHPSYFLASSFEGARKTSPFVREARPTIETAVGMRRDERTPPPPYARAA